MARSYGLRASFVLTNQTGDRLDDPDGSARLPAATLDDSLGVEIQRGRRAARERDARRARSGPRRALADGPRGPAKRSRGRQCRCRRTAAGPAAAAAPGRCGDRLPSPGRGSLMLSLARASAAHRSSRRPRAGSSQASSSALLIAAVGPMALGMQHLHGPLGIDGPLRSRPATSSSLARSALSAPSSATSSPSRTPEGSGALITHRVRAISEQDGRHQFHNPR